VSDTTPAQMQRLLATEFERRGWDYDLSVGRDILEEAERRGEVDGAALSKRVSAEFLGRNRASREDVADAIESAIGGRRLKRDAEGATIVIKDNRYQVNLSGGSQIKNSKLNIGDGTQINVDVKASKENILTAVEALLVSGLTETWNADAARDLASVIDEREDIDVEDVREITTEVVKAEQPKQGRVRTMLNEIAVSGLGGALSTGISSGLGELIGHLPM
jgi:hypothetical protein